MESAPTLVWWCQNWVKLQDTQLVSAENWRIAWCGKPTHLLSQALRVGKQFPFSGKVKFATQNCPPTFIRIPKRSTCRRSQGAMTWPLSASFSQLSLLLTPLTPALQNESSLGAFALLVTSAWNPPLQDIFSAHPSRPSSLAKTSLPWRTFALLLS